MLWSNEKIRNAVFSKVNPTGSSSMSSAKFSSYKMSSQSISHQPLSAKEKRHSHLGSYSSLLQKEVGGLSVKDMHGSVFIWGTDQNGQLGLDILVASGYAPALKVLYPRMMVSLKEELIKEICCGHAHTMAITIAGNVFVWGQNDSGQLGLGESAPKCVRKPVMNKHLQNVVKVSCGNEHSLAITKNNDLYIWGLGGVLGLGDLETRFVPTKHESLSKLKIMIAICGGLHTLVTAKDGDTYSFGMIEGGQLGLPLNLL